MEPLPATADALRTLADVGDADLGTRVDSMGEIVLDLAPQADALAIWGDD